MYRTLLMESCCLEAWDRPGKPQGFDLNRNTSQRKDMATKKFPNKPSAGAPCRLTRTGETHDAFKQSPELRRQCCVAVGGKSLDSATPKLGSKTSAEFDQHPNVICCFPGDPNSGVKPFPHTLRNPRGKAKAEFLMGHTRSRQPCH